MKVFSPILFCGKKLLNIFPFFFVLMTDSVFLHIFLFRKSVRNFKFVSFEIRWCKEGKLVVFVLIKLCNVIKICLIINTYWAELPHAVIFAKRLFLFGCLNAILFCYISLCGNNPLLSFTNSKLAIVFKFCNLFVSNYLRISPV